MRGFITALFVLSLTTRGFAAGFCFGDSPGGGNGAVDCDASAPIQDISYEGYSTHGLPCELGTCGGPDDYLWTISASESDPTVNYGPLPEGETSLYLWLQCTTSDGLAAAAFSIYSDDPSLIYLDLTPAPAAQNFGTHVNPVFSVSGCPTGPVLIAELSLTNLGATSVESGSWGGVKASYR